MKTITQILLLLVIGLIAVSCGHDEPDYYSQEATGETFIENGVLVEANTDFSQEMLTYALSMNGKASRYFSTTKNMYPIKSPCLGLRYTSTGMEPLSIARIWAPTQAFVNTRSTRMF